MKLSLALLAVLVASTSATPVRLITTTSDLELTPEDVSVYPPEALADAISPPDITSNPTPVATAEAHAEKKPCHGASPLTSLLSRLGLTMPASRVIEISAGPSSHPHPHRARPHGHDGHSQTNRESLFEAWRQHLADHVPSLSTSRILPLMGDESIEEGRHLDRTPEIKWWRPAGEGKWEVKDGQGEWRVPRRGEKPPRTGREKDRKHGLRRQGNVLFRLHRALKHLTHAESIALALVTGAGIGSILHFILMIVILTVRRLRSSPEDRLSRRAARRAARKARKDARKAAKHGALYLAGEEHVPGQVEKVVVHDEELPVYDEGEDAHLVCEKYEAA
ncbi:hypothetical protein IAT38_005028 [Cryptococcus sp. DSM 104549]